MIDPAPPLPAGDPAALRDPRLVALWPTLTARAAAGDRTMLVVNSVNFDIPEHLNAVVPAYEERFLFVVLTLLRQPGGRVVYVTSQPVLPRLVDYYFSMVPGLAGRERLHLVSIGDGSPGPLTRKIVSRPRLVERLRRLVADPDRALIFPFSTTEAEMELGALLDVPVYGPHPSLAHLGTKTGSRQVFAAAGVPAPAGVEGVRTRAEVRDAIRAIVAARPAATAVVVKLDDSISGLGNAVVRLTGGDLDEDLDAAEPQDTQASAAEFFATLERRGGIVEERIVAPLLLSPSVQLRAGPLGQVEVLSTHDQLLGGPSGQSFLGCRFPADPAYAPLVTEYALRVGERLAAHGVVGRFGIDFVVHPDGDGWTAYAIEVNLRNGGTTHPLLTLAALTDGTYDAAAGEFRCADGTARHYVASDHVESPAYRSLTPDDLLDLVDERGLGWDPDTRTGLAFHMVSALAVAGQVGVTAVGTTPGQADELFAGARRALDEAAGA
ncbi:MAG TPA: peptide ligase PGM1-related protein [Frankiaceae bacterium]|nr:peptide ligase PGM1-related protein [Frankiaceae bacterium]